MIERQTEREAASVAAQIGALALLLSAVGAFGDASLAPISYVVALGFPALVMLSSALRSSVHRRSWQMLGAGMSLWAIAGALVTMQQSANVGSIPDLAIDALYVAGYVPMLIGVVAFAGPSAASGRWASLVDWLLFFTVAYGALWMLVVEPATLNGGQSVYQRALSSIYPAGDVALVMASWRLLRARAVRTRVGLLLVIGFALSAFADVALLTLSVRNPNGSWPITDFGYLIGCGVLAVAAPFSTVVSHRSLPTTRVRHTSQSLVAAFALAGPVVWCATAAFGLRPVRGLAVATWISVVVVLLVLRGTTGRRLVRADEREEHWRATHDAATGMYLRAPFMQLASQGGVRERVGTVLVITPIDLAAYGAIGDGLIADVLLDEFGRRLRDSTSEGSLLARLSYDEFAVFMRSSDSSRCGLLADAVLTAMRDPFEVDGCFYDLRINVGVAQTDGAVIDLLAGLRRAGEAMGHARHLGPGRAAIDHELTGAPAVTVSERASGTDVRVDWPSAVSTIAR